SVIAATRTRTSRAPGTGVGTSSRRSTSRGAPYSCSRQALIDSSFDLATPLYTRYVPDRRHNTASLFPPIEIEINEKETGMTKYAAEAVGTFWLVLGGCGSAVLAAAFPSLGIGLLRAALAFGPSGPTMP